MCDRIYNQLPNLPFILGDYEFIELIGSGGFSAIFKVRQLSSRQLFAAKSCKVKRNDSHKRNVTLSEINALKCLYHPNIIKIYDIVEGFGHIFMVLEYISGGEIKSYIHKNQGLRPKALISAVYQILTAVEFCHSLHVAHHDIKPENILVDDNRCVLIDFGLSHVMNENDKVQDGSGSLPYKAPETFLKKEYDPFKADVWSLGITIHVMATGDFPWVNGSNAKDAITNSFISISQKISYNLQMVIRSALTYDPKKRPTVSDLLLMQYFQQPIERVPIAMNDFSQASKTLRSFKAICIPKVKRLSRKSASLSSLSSLPILIKSPSMNQNSTSILV